MKLSEQPQQESLHFHVLADKYTQDRNTILDLDAPGHCPNTPGHCTNTPGHWHLAKTTQIQSCLVTGQVEIRVQV